VLASSWARKRIGTAWWRRVHLLAVPTFTLSLLHGLFAGTDSGRPWMFAMYVGTGLATLVLVIVRGITVSDRQPRDGRERARLPA
jgi:DMSO/TMAO reductase YedYZ heme-binding membrane subunit